jgi:hypothetical protein
MHSEAAPSGSSLGIGNPNFLVFAYVDG